MVVRFGFALAQVVNTTDSLDKEDSAICYRYAALQSVDLKICMLDVVGKIIFPQNGAQERVEALLLSLGYCRKCDCGC